MGTSAIITYYVIYGIIIYISYVIDKNNKEKLSLYESLLDFLAFTALWPFVPLIFMSENFKLKKKITRLEKKVYGNKSKTKSQRS